MLYIKTKCPSCGIIRVKATDVKIHLKPENIPESVLLFRCSSCNQKLAAKPHNKKLLQDIRDAGAGYAHKEDLKEFMSILLAHFLPDKLIKTLLVDNKKTPSEKATNNDPLFTKDDLLDMHLMMETIENVDDFLNAAKDEDDDA